MQPFWVLPQEVTIEAKDEAEARKLLAELGIVPTSVQKLPYPSRNRVGLQTNCPSFCYDPKKCAGRTSCPQGYACSE